MSAVSIERKFITRIKLPALGEADILSAHEFACLLPIAVISEAQMNCWIRPKAVGSLLWKSLSSGPILSRKLRCSRHSMAMAVTSSERPSSIIMVAEWKIACRANLRSFCTPMWSARLASSNAMRVLPTNAFRTRFAASQIPSRLTVGYLMNCGEMRSLPNSKERRIASPRPLRSRSRTQS